MKLFPFRSKAPEPHVEVARAVVHRYQAGDLIVLKSSRPLPSALIKPFVKKIESLLPGAKVMFLDRGLEIEVIHDDTPPPSELTDPKPDILGVAGPSAAGDWCGHCGQYDAPIAPEGAPRCPCCDGSLP